MQPSTCVVYRSKHFQNEVQCISKLLFCYIFEINRVDFCCFLSRIKLHKLWYGKEWYASLTVVYSLIIFLKYLKLDFKGKK